MHLDRRLLGWGVFFILLGAVPLAVRANAVDPDVVGRWPLLWPLILVGWGLGLILRGTSIAWVGGALAAVTLGLMGGGAIATGFSGVPVMTGCGDGPGQTFQQQTGSFGGAVRMDVEFNCGSLSVATVDGSAWSVGGSDQDGRGPAVDVGADGQISIESRNRGLSLGDGRATWNVGVPRAPHLELDITLNAGEATVDLSGATIDAFSLTVNAGSMSADLAAAKALPRDGFNATVNAGKATLSLPGFDGTAGLSLNAGSLIVCVPPGTALEVRWSGTFASNDLAANGLVKTGDSTWTTAGFDPAAAHVTLDVSANAGSFNLKQGGTCGA
jgi:hypothetical protein